MNPFLTYVVVRTTLQHRKKSSGNSPQYSPYELAKAYRTMMMAFRRILKDTFFIAAGILSAAFGFKGFLLTNEFIDGGATGIALLLSALIRQPFPILLLVVNVPFVVLAYRMMGRTFALKTAAAIGILALCVAFIPFPDVTQDNLLVAIFGGFFLGAGIGLAVRGGAVIDGTEVLAIYLSRKLGMTLGDIVIGINILIFSVAAWLLSIEIAMYSLITYLAASKTLDYFIEGVEEYIGVTIVAKRSDAIRKMIINELGRGVTLLNGKRGYGETISQQPIHVVYTVVTRLELRRLKNELEKIEPDAFVVMHSVKDIKGGTIKKRPLAH